MSVAQLLPDCGMYWHLRDVWRAGRLQLAENLAWESICSYWGVKVRLASETWPWEYLKAMLGETLVGGHP